MNEKREFDISVIIPIYNTEAYLEETIQSVIGQTLGFKQHIQLILINDGSTDGSENICLKYQRKYPNNIIYKYKENGGVSSACNLGKEYAEGTFVNFFGSDDKWSKDTFKSVYELIKKDKEKSTDVISAKIILFDDLNAEEPRNFQYGSTRIVDLTQKEFFRYTQISLGNCFIRNETLKKHRFDEELNFMEDTLFLNIILLEKCTVGLISKGAYYARVRKARTNLSSVAKKDKTRYLITPNRCFLRLFELSKEKYGRVLPYLQFSVMFDVQYRFEERLPASMSDEDMKEYEDILRKLLMDVDDSTIFGLKHLNIKAKLFMYRIRHGKSFFKDVEWKKGRAYYNGDKVYTLLGTNRVYWDVLEIKDSNILLKGSTDLIDLDVPFKVWIQDEEGKCYDVAIERFPAKDRIAYNGTVLSKGCKIEATIPLRSGKKYSFFVQIEDNAPFRIKTGFGWNGKLNHLLEDSYWCGNDHILKLIKGRICVYGYTKKTHMVSELRYIRQILARKKEKIAWKSEDFRYVGYRLLYHLTNLFNGNKERWLIVDRETAATDNGAALFKYAAKEKDRNKEIVLALDKSSSNYADLRQYGKIIKPESLRYKIRFLLSDIVISTDSEGVAVNPFIGPTFLVKDLKKNVFVYLQHGVMQEDNKVRLNVLQRNIKLLSTTTMAETKQIVDDGYGYSSEQVKLLGSPRFDGLSKYDKSKKIIIMPTSCYELIYTIHNRKKYFFGFKNTTYFRFYNDLINNRRLIETVENNGYECEFYIHPTLVKQADDFLRNGTVKIMRENANYEKALGEAAVLITDYSGTQFDFAYQGKPLIYFHFDDEDSDILKQRYDSRKSYFDYDTEGFGPIAHTVDEVVDELIKVLKNEDKMEDIYKERARDFFYYNDENNSKRVYDELCSLNN